MSRLCSRLIRLELEASVEFSFVFGRIVLLCYFYRWDLSWPAPILSVFGRDSGSSPFGDELRSFFLFSLLSLGGVFFLPSLLPFPSSLDPRLVSLSLSWEAWDGRFLLGGKWSFGRSLSLFSFWEISLGLKLFSWRHSTAGVLNHVHAFSGALLEKVVSLLSRFLFLEFIPRIFKFGRIFPFPFVLLDICLSSRRVFFQGF